MAFRVLSVSQLNRFVKALLGEAPQLSEVYVRGELSNLSLYQRSGHLYFTVKDESSAIKAVMFSDAASRLRFQPQNGLAVIVRGKVTLYERDGAYQLYASDIIPDGAGALTLQFEQLKKKLGEEGLFDPGRKRALPSFPSVIGVVTSPGAAALGDIISVLGRRYPTGTLLLSPCQVQGEKASQSIALAVDALNRDGRAQVILLARGGGSLEDLWAFNEEATVRAVARSRIPIVSAVGHETDVTLCDFAADLRAPTPSAAAELVAPDLSELRGRLFYLEQKLRNLSQNAIFDRMTAFSRLSSSEILQNPYFLVDKNRQKLDNLIKSIHRLSKESVRKKETEFGSIAALLESLSPLSVLSRGYSITTRGDEIVSSAAEVGAGDTLVTTLGRGKIKSRVLETWEEET